MRLVKKYVGWVLTDDFGIREEPVKIDPYDELHLDRRVGSIYEVNPMPEPLHLKEFDPMYKSSIFERVEMPISREINTLSHGKLRINKIFP